MISMGKGRKGQILRDQGDMYLPRNPPKRSSHSLGILAYVTVYSSILSDFYGFYRVHTTRAPHFLVRGRDVEQHPAENVSLATNFTAWVALPVVFSL